MRIDEVQEYDVRQQYQSKCDQCGAVHRVYTQADNDPEYYTKVYLSCHCEDKYGKESLVEFILPVN